MNAFIAGAPALWLRPRAASPPTALARAWVQAMSELLCVVIGGSGWRRDSWSAPGPRTCPTQKRHVTYKRVWGAPVGARHRTYTEEEPLAVPGIVDGQTHRLLLQLRDIRAAGHGAVRRHR